MGFIFKPKLVKQIVEGNKTQTRRPVRDGDTSERFFRYDGSQPKMVELIDCVRRSNRRLHYLGAVRSVVWGRGKLTVVWCAGDQTWYMPGSRNEQKQYLGAGYQLLKIKIVRIRREDVRRISREDAIAEGFADTVGFWRVWCGFYDPSALDDDEYDLVSKMASRPDKLYQAWAYDFEVQS